jgi:hypothetical protein
MLEYEPSDSDEQELPVEPACHDCEYWKEMIQEATNKISPLRGKMLIGTPAEQELEELESVLRDLVLGQMARRRDAH